MKLPNDLRELAVECKIAHISASEAAPKEKLKYLTDRNFLRSKMVWLYGLTLTRKALAQIEATHLVDKIVHTDLETSVQCCINYEQKAIRAAEQKKEDKARDLIEARDFLLSKMVWQHGAIEICNMFRSVGHDPIDRKELIRILREPAPSAFDRMAAKVERAEKLAQELISTSQVPDEDEELQQLKELLQVRPGVKPSVDVELEALKRQMKRSKEVEDVADEIEDAWASPKPSPTVEQDKFREIIDRIKEI